MWSREDPTITRWGSRRTHLALRVLVGQAGAQGLHHGKGCEVLRGDQLDAMDLAVGLGLRGGEREPHLSGAGRWRDRKAPRAAKVGSCSIQRATATHKTGPIGTGTGTNE